MKILVQSGFGLALLLAPTLAFAQELQWRPAGGQPTAGLPSVGLSRPVPLNDPASGVADPVSPGLRIIVRAQAVDDLKPLPPGPGSLDGKIPPVVSSPLAQEGVKPPKTGEFVPPAPKLALPGSPGISSSALGPCDNCCNPCPTNCGGCGLFGHGWFGCGDFCNGVLSKCGMGEGGWLSGLWNHCDGCDPCCNRPRIWGYADYLLWIPRGQSMQPLIVASAAGTQPVGANTMTLFSGFDNPARSGIRFGGGLWFHQDGNWGLDANFWFLMDQSRTFTVGSNGNPSIGRPFIEVGPNNPGQSAETVAYTGPTGPGLPLANSVGTVSVRDYQQLWSTDINLRRKLWCGPSGSLDLLLGYRYLWLSEGLEFTENLTLVAPSAPVGGVLIVSDRFHTTNSFNGAQIGLAWNWQFAPRWYLNTNLKVAFGNVHEEVDIQGNTLFTGAYPATVLRTGGLLALPTNIGTQTADRFAVMPEVGLKLGFNVTPSLSIYAGYDFTFISSVVRPADQIDPVLNTTQRPSFFGNQTITPGTAARPAPVFATQSFWVHGVNFGLMYRY